MEKIEKQKQAESSNIEEVSTQSWAFDSMRQLTSITQEFQHGNISDEAKHRITSSDEAMCT